MKWLLLIAAGSFAFTLTGHAQSLGDIGRQERARQKKIEGKVIVTNETLQPPEAKTEPKTEGDSETKSDTNNVNVLTPAEPPISTDNDGHDEKWWRTRFDTARTDLKRAEDNATVLELKLNELSKDLLNRSDIYNREQVVGAQIQETKADLATAREEADSARLKIDQLQEELHKAGGPAGWGR